jgi:hypothetical protein
MTGAQLLLLMATWQCHTLAVDIPERRETVVQTVCVKTEVKPKAAAPAVKKKHVTKKPAKRRYSSRRRHTR